MHSVAVFCGSKKGNNPVFEAAAVTVGQELVRRGATLVYGGGDSGLMGVLSLTVRSLGGNTPVGVNLRQWASGQEGETVVDSLLERKALMAELSDCSIALPGGLGTLDELAEMGTWLTLGIHTKPCGILNCDGFYDHQLAQFALAQASGFQTWPDAAIPDYPFIVRSDAVELLDAMAAAVAKAKAALEAAPVES